MSQPAKFKLFCAALLAASASLTYGAWRLGRPESSVVLQRGEEWVFRAPAGTTGGCLP